MWIFTTDGFFSVVAHRTEDATLIVRTRKREDLERLRKRARIKGAIRHTPDADYPFRMHVNRNVFANVLFETSRTMRYDNFKNAVANEHGYERATIYSRIWSMLRHAFV